MASRRRRPENASATQASARDLDARPFGLVCEFSHRNLVDRLVWRVKEEEGDLIDSSSAARVPPVLTDG